MNTLLKFHNMTTRYDSTITNWMGSLLSLAIRFYIGWQFFKSGLTKTKDWDTTLFLFTEEYSVPLLSPELAASLGTFGELALPVLLFIGIFSRPAALGLFIVNIVAVISYPALFGFACPAAVNDHITWGALLLVIVAFGPGRISLDAWFSRLFR